MTFCLKIDTYKVPDPKIVNSTMHKRFLKVTSQKRVERNDQCGEDCKHHPMKDPSILSFYKKTKTLDTVLFFFYFYFGYNTYPDKQADVVVDRLSLFWSWDVISVVEPIGLSVLCILAFSFSGFYPAFVN